MGVLDYFITPKGLVEYGPDEFDRVRKSDSAVTIDVRTRSEYSRGHMNGCVHIPLNTLKDRLYSLEKDKSYLLVCATGHRSRAAAAIMLRNDFKSIAHLKGGMAAWRRMDKEVTRS